MGINQTVAHYFADRQDFSLAVTDEHIDITIPDPERPDGIVLMNRFYLVSNPQKLNEYNSVNAAISLVENELGCAPGTREDIRATLEYELAA